MVRQQAGGKNLKFKSSSSSTYSSAGLKCADNVEWTLKSSCIWARLSLASLFFWASLCHEMRKKHYRQELFPYELLSCFNRTGSVPTLLLYGQNTETPAERVTITCLSTDLETGPLRIMRWEMFDFVLLILPTVGTWSVSSLPTSVHMQSVHLSFPVLWSAPSLIGTTLSRKSEEDHADTWGVDSTLDPEVTFWCVHV